jgi:hypothetical protein
VPLKALLSKLYRYLRLDTQLEPLSRSQSPLGRKEGAGRAEWLQLLAKERLGTSCALSRGNPSFPSLVELRYLWIGLRTTITVDGKPQEVLVNECVDEGDPQDVARLVERVSLSHTIWIVNWDTKVTLYSEPVPLIPEVRVMVSLHYASLTRSLSSKIHFKQERTHTLLSVGSRSKSLSLEI